MHKKFGYSSLLTIFLILGSSFSAQANKDIYPSSEHKVFRQPPHTDKYAAFKIAIPPSGYIPLSDGTQAPYRKWDATSQMPKAIILAFHGFNDSRDAWELPAPSFTQSGITLYAVDIRGFGGTASRGHWPSLHHVQNDIIEEARFIARRHPRTPLYLMGESMGGAYLITLAGTPALYKQLPDISGYILLAPAIRQIDLASDFTLDIISTLAPNWRIEPGDLPKGVTASNNRMALVRTFYNPLTLRSTPLSSLRGLVDLMNEAHEKAAHICCHTLLLYGGKDELVPADSMGPLWSQFPKQVRKDFLPQGYHLLLRDHEREMPTRDIINWVFAPYYFLPSGGDISAGSWDAGQPWEDSPFPLLPSQLDTIP